MENSAYPGVGPELYRDIAERTQGDIYMGVVGPVRTGKSTFIKRFMELMVLGGLAADDQAGRSNRERIIDELPISGAGRMIMTTQPRFIPTKPRRSRWTRTPACACGWLTAWATWCAARRV